MERPDLTWPLSRDIRPYCGIDIVNSENKGKILEMVVPNIHMSGEVVERHGHGAYIVQASRWMRVLVYGMSIS